MSASSATEPFSLPQKRKVPPGGNWAGGKPANWIVPALLTALLVFQLGYSYGEDNLALLLPWIFRRMDPGMLANDWFANTIPHHLNFVIFFAWLGRLMPLPASMLALHLVVLFAVVTLAYRTTPLLFEGQGVFLIAFFLLLRWGTQGLGGNGLWANYLLPHHAAVPFCLGAFYFMLREKPFPAALAAAAATWIHIQLGVHTMLVLGAGMLLWWRHWGLRRIVAAGALFTAAIAPTLIAQWKLYVSAPSAFASAREFLYVHAFLRQPHHLIPSSWAGGDYYRFFLMLAMGAMAFDWKRRAHRAVLTWVAVILALCAVGTVFVEWIPVRLIIKMQLFRLTIFVKYFAVLFAAKFLLDLLHQGWKHKACALVILAIQNFAVIGIFAALAAALRVRSRWLWGTALFAAGIVAGVMMAATLSLGAPIPMFVHSFAVGQRGIAVGLGSLAGLAVLAWWRARAIPAALLGLAVVLRLITGFAYFGYDHPPVDAWYQFCRQLRDRTPRDAVFIVPPYLGGFTFYAERAEVADFKNTPSIERDLLEWKRRMDALVGAELRCSGWVNCSGDLAYGYLRLRESDFLRLADKYHAQYLIATKPDPRTHGQRLGFPEDFRSGDYILYRVPAH